MDLDLDRHTGATIGHALIDSFVRWQIRRDAAPIFQPTTTERIESMLAPPPEQGAVLERLLDQLLAAADGGWSKSHGGDLAFVPCGGIASGAHAALLAASLHVFTGASFEAPALIALEEGVLRWFGTVFGLPAAAEGLLLSGGSTANQTAIVCARETLAFDARRHVAYLSEHAHHSLHKGLRLAGIPITALRTVAADAATRIDVAALQEQIAADRKGGRVPWLIVGTAGNTDSGAVDDLDALASIAAEAGAWLHVDAAYGGMFMLTARGRERMHGIERADSITVDAHKGLFLPYGISALLVRRPGVLARSHEELGAYQRDLPLPHGLPHYMLRGPELTRPFRGLLVWWPLHLHGVAAFRAVLDRSLDLARSAHEAIAGCAGVEPVCEPELSIATLRAASGDGATEALLDAINRSGRLHVSSTTLFGRVAIRLAFLHPKSGRAEIETLLEVVRASGHAQ